MDIAAQIDTYYERIKGGPKSNLAEPVRDYYTESALCNYGVGSG